MGLLQEALLLANKKQNLQKEGLFSKKETNPCKIFGISSWAKFYRFSHAAIFQCIENTYVITDAYMLDADTIKKSTATFDFFNGTLLSKANWIFCVSGTKSMEPFFQFFSKKLKDSIRGVTFLKLASTEKPPVLMLVSLEKENFQVPESSYKFKSQVLSLIGKKETEPNLQARLTSMEKTPADLFIISLKLALENEFLQENLPQQTKTILKQTIFHELFTIVNDSFDKHHICAKGENFEIKTAFFSTSEQDVQVLQKMISQKMSSILSEDSCSKILVLAVKNSSNTTEISDFLLNG